MQRSGTRRSYVEQRTGARSGQLVDSALPLNGPMRCDSSVPSSTWRPRERGRTKSCKMTVTRMSCGTMAVALGMKMLQPRQMCHEISSTGRAWRPTAGTPMISSRAFRRRMLETPVLRGRGSGVLTMRWASQMRMALGRYQTRTSHTFPCPRRRKDSSRRRGRQPRRRHSRQRGACVARRMVRSTTTRLTSSRRSLQRRLWGPRTKTSWQRSRHSAHSWCTRRAEWTLSMAPTIDMHSMTQLCRPGSTKMNRCTTSLSCQCPRSTWHSSARSSRTSTHDPSARLLRRKRERGLAPRNEWRRSRNRLRALRNRRSSLRDQKLGRSRNS
mmetsp:Transcript_1221/g.2694  ORF Transcript_1221/g.2694 Transcript_1221/m.2694 type:complete len:327 (-) Transcript_1221:851-1831(-)